MTTFDFMPAPMLDTSAVTRRSLRNGASRASDKPLTRREIRLNESLSTSSPTITRRQLRKGGVPTSNVSVVRHELNVETSTTQENPLVSRRALRAAESAKATKPAKPAHAVGAHASHRAATTESSASLKQLLRALWTGFSAALFALALGLAALVVVVPISVGGQAMTVLTNSMAPGLPPGTLVIVKPTPVEDVKVGDVLTYQIRPGEPDVVSHRVVSRTISTSGETTFITRGDNNDLDDPNPVQAAQIRGTVWYSLPLLGWVNSAVSGNARMWLVPAIAVACFGYGAWAFTSSALTRRRKALAKNTTPGRYASEASKTRGRRSSALAEGPVGAVS